MPSQGQRLAQVQLDGHRAIDAVYQPLSIAIVAAVMRRATPDANGILRLSLPARAAILLDVGRLIDQTRLNVFSAILAAAQTASLAAQVGAEPLARHEMTEIALATHLSAAPALRTDRESVISQTGALLVKGIAAGGLASKVAKTVKEYFSPWFSEYRSETGKLLHTDRLGAVRHWPGMSGAASQHARLVLLTETTAAHGRTVKRIAERDDLGLKWNLSRRHPGHAPCVENAERDSGFGPGIYESRDFPSIPQHPRCRCYASTAELRAS
jgi:hypothetical protein